VYYILLRDQRVALIAVEPLRQIGRAKYVLLAALYAQIVATAHPFVNVGQSAQ
jgi:hypothetical protein